MGITARINLLKNNVEKININPKLILSGYKYMHSEKFKFWVALKTIKNNSKFIVSMHGGGNHIKFDPHFNFENRIVLHRLQRASAGSSLVCWVLVLASLPVYSGIQVRSVFHFSNSFKMTESRKRSPPFWGAQYWYSPDGKYFFS